MDEEMDAWKREMPTAAGAATRPPLWKSKNERGGEERGGVRFVEVGDVAAWGGAEAGGGVVGGVRIWR